LTVTVDPSRTYQTMVGFGASLTESSAAVLDSLSPAVRQKTMAALFDPRSGDGLSYLRQPIGGSDFVVGGPYTYDDVPAGQTDFELRRFSIARDQRQIIPLLRQALALNPRLRIMASPWSPPAWMKTGGSLIGGRLIDDPRIYQTYARYFVKFIQAYAREGIPIDAVTVQNEPQNRTPKGYPGMDLPMADESRLIQALGPALRAAGLGTKILGFDHNWAMHPDDIAALPPGQLPDLTYANDLLADPATARWLAGTAYHCYFGDPSAQRAQHDRYPDKAVYFTECSGIRSSQPANTFSDTLKWHSRNLIIGVTRNWAATVVNWNLALDANGGPHVGGCDVCTGLVTVNPDGSATTNAEYYTLGHLTRFVRPGAVRIASTSFGTTGWNGQIMDAAFRNRDGSLVLVAHNENDDPRTFAVALGGSAFTYTLPGGALATFTWPGDAIRDTTGDLLPLAAGSGSAQPSGPADPCCSGDVVANAVDDDASTRWSSGAGQQPGQYLQVDLGRRTRADRLVLDTGASTGDYPRGYQLLVSDDGLHWSGPVATGAGRGQLTEIRLPRRPARFLRVALTQSTGNWWSVADVRVYR
jgi:glucosylceramidase